MSEMRRRLHRAQKLLRGVYSGTAKMMLALDTALPQTWPSVAPTRTTVALLALTCVALGCPRQAPHETTLPLLTTDDHAAERELTSARDAAERGDDSEARSRYEAFLSEHPEDPLVPMAQLGLGRLALAEGRADDADALFRLVAEHTDPSVAERGRFYRGIAQHLAGREDQALEMLRPFVGRVVDPDENALLLRTIAAASLVQGNRIGAVEALDMLIGSAAPAASVEEARSRLATIIASEVSPEEVRTLYGRLSRRGAAWPLAAARTAREAFAAGDLGAVQGIVTEMREHGVTLDAELSAMALRAERTGEADPRVIGAVLPLTGRGRRAGEMALRGLMLAAGIPASGPTSDDAPQIIVRDSMGDPAKARAAVDDLVSLHRAMVIIGPIDRVASRAAAERAAELEVPLIALSPEPTLEQVGPGIFRILPDAQQELEELVAAARQRGATRVALLTADNPYGRAMRDAAITASVEFVAHAHYAEDRHDLRDAIDLIREAHPDAVLLGDTARSVQIVAPTLASRGLYCAPEGARVPRGAQRVRYLLPQGAHSPALLRAASRYLTGALISAPFDANAAGEQANFGAAYQARYGSAPQLFAADAFDAFWLVRDAQRAGALTRQALAQRLPTTSNRATAGPSGGLTSERGPRRATRVIEYGVASAAIAPLMREAF